MKNTKISRFMQIFDKETNTHFRILNVTQEYAIFINMDTLYKCDIRRLIIKSVFQRLNNGQFSIIKEPEDKTIIEEELLPENVLTKYKRNKIIIDAINACYAPDYIGLMEKRNKPVINELIIISQLARSNLWRIIIKYLQSGCKESSLLRTVPTANLKDKTSKFKRGRISPIEEGNGKILTDKDRDIMAIYVKKYLENKLLTLQKSYDDMILDYYTIQDYKDGTLVYEELPYDQRPTIHQFRYYYRQHTSQIERMESKYGKRKFQNQKRLLKGTAKSNIHGPGDVFEIDACELDISVVSLLDRNKAAGSPVVYFMIDVYSCLIVGASLSFDNNSIIAMTNCLASLVENKEKILQSVGINFTQPNPDLSLNDVMPSNIKPHTIRADHGSDFISKQTHRIARELSIELQYAPPGTGSMKGTVERSFRSFQKNFTDLTFRAGTKDYSEGKSKHNTQAKLTIEDVRRLMYSFILQHNSTQHQSNYDLTPDMVKNNVGRIPAEIWKYGCKNIGAPPTITNPIQFLYSIMVPAKAKLKRNGIVYKNLRYIPDYHDTKTQDTMFVSEHSNTPFDIRIDPRSIRQVYYIDNRNQLRTAELVNDDNHRVLAGMTWPEFDDFRKEQRKLLKEKEIISGKTRRAHRRDDRDTVKNAKALSGKGKTDDKNMRETRAAEKNRVSQEYAFENRFNLTTQEQKPQKAEDTKRIIPTTAPAIQAPETAQPDKTKETKQESWPDATNMTTEEKIALVAEMTRKAFEEDEEDEYADY